MKNKIIIKIFRYIAFILICISVILYYEGIIKVNAQEGDCVKTLPTASTYVYGWFGDGWYQNSIPDTPHNYCALGGVGFKTDDDCEDFIHYTYPCPDTPNDGKWCWAMYVSGEGYREGWIRLNCLTWE